MKNSKKNRSYIGASDYTEGRTELSHEQMGLLESISKASNYSYDNYNNLPRSYAPKGLIAILRDQVKAKLENGTINEVEGKEVTAIIDLLEIKLIQDN